MDDDLRMRMFSLEKDITVLNAKVDTLVSIIGAGRGIAPKASEENAEPPAGPSARGREAHADTILLQFTLKQHAVMQLLLNGARTSGIAEVMDVTESTVKVHIRSICQKLGANKRIFVIGLYSEAYAGVTPERYAVLTRLPYDWAQNPSKYPEVTQVLREKVR